MNLLCKFTIEKSKQNELVNLFVSEKKNNKKDAIVLSNSSDKIILHQIVLKNPFNIYDIYEYELLEFLPRETFEDLGFLIE